MSDPVIPASRRAPRRGLAGPLLLVLLALALAGGWRAWQARTAAADSAVQRLERLERAQAALEQALQQQAAALGERVARNERTLAELGETVHGGRSRLQLAAIEQLLLLASDRLLLARDVAGAQVALDLADQRLAALADPRLHRVREALARERAALAALPKLDLAGGVLALGALIERAPQWPLRTRRPERIGSDAPAAEAPADASRLQRLWVAVRNALAAMVVLRREDAVSQRLAPEQEALVRQILLLKLEGARLALLAGDGRALGELAAGARAWLAEYYRTDDAQLRAADAELARLAQLPPAVPPQELGAGLEALRAALERP